ncbi:group II intron maturase-specific domain-containing protein [Segatella copri]|uniref:group II intron maturase-specific domain-containing protein n=1 Tax=Segatella copri TaxID=165179 RepID=UPI003B51E91F
MSNEVDKQISGWMNYCMKFCRSEFRMVLNYIKERLTRWVMRKVKRFSKGRKFSRAYEWLVVCGT